MKLYYLGGRAFKDHIANTFKINPNTLFPVIDTLRLRSHDTLIIPNKMQFNAHHNKTFTYAKEAGIELVIFDDSDCREQWEQNKNKT